MSEELVNLLDIKFNYDLALAHKEFVNLLKAHITLPEKLPFVVFDTSSDKLNYYKIEVRLKYDYIPYSELKEFIKTNPKVLEFSREIAFKSLTKATSCSIERFCKKLCPDLKDDVIRNISDIIYGELVVRNLVYAETEADYLKAFTASHTCMYFDAKSASTYIKVHYDPDAVKWHENIFSEQNVHPCLYFHDSPFFKIMYIQSEKDKDKALARVTLRLMPDGKWVWNTLCGEKQSARDKAKTDLKKLNISESNHDFYWSILGPYRVKARRCIHPLDKKEYLILPIAHDDVSIGVGTVYFDKSNEEFILEPPNQKGYRWPKYSHKGIIKHDAPGVIQK